VGGGECREGTGGCGEKRVLAIFVIFLIIREVAYILVVYLLFNTTCFGFNI
jgi:hypothetical protein